MTSETHASAPSMALRTPLPVGRKPRRDDVFECEVESLLRRGGAKAH